MNLPSSPRIPAILTDPDVNGRYMNTLGTFLEEGLRDHRFRLVRHQGVEPRGNDVSCWLQRDGNHTDRQRGIGAIVAMLDTYGQTRPELVSVDDMFEWVLTRVDVIDTYRTQMSYAELEQRTLLQHDDNWRFIAPLMRCRVPFTRQQMDVYRDVVTMIERVAEQPKLLVADPVPVHADLPVLTAV